VAQEPAATKISVRGLWKLFGVEGRSAIDPRMEGMSKSEIQQEFGVVTGLRDVSFDVQTGEVFVVMGLSGSGKSTLIRNLVRLIEPTAGQILVDGEDVLTYDEKQLIAFRRTKMAMVFQHFGLLPHRTVLENAAFALELRGVDRDEREERARETLGMVGLQDWTTNYPHTLSGGMQQRVGLARAIAADTDVLLMDEPFSGLDPLIRRDMQNELVRLQDQLQKTIVFITHDLAEAVKLGTHILIMRDGQAVQVGTPEEILNNPADEYVTEFTRDVRRSTVLTVRSIANRPRVRLQATQTPKQAMDSLAEAGEVAAFVVDARRTYQGAVSFNSLAEANQREDTDLSGAYLGDVPTLNADNPVESVVAAMTNQAGSLPVVDSAGRLVGELAPTAVARVMDEEFRAAEAAAAGEPEPEAESAEAESAGKGA
jgi:glycine betaine/proline transport system ATP-binding protein